MFRSADERSGCCACAAEPFVEADAAKTCFAQWHNRALLDPAAVVSGPRGRSRPYSGGLSHCRPLIIVDNVPPESIRAAAQDIACRASEVHVLAVGTCAIN